MSLYNIHEGIFFMKWVFCINEYGSHTYNLFLLKYALLSAKKYTNLEPVCLLLGNNSYLETFLKQQKVQVIKATEPAASYQFKFFHTSSDFWNLNYEKIINFSSGAFLRFEIANYIEDEYCLYTDIDVLFTDKFKIPENKPKYMAMANQKNNEKKEFNTGVILFNLKNFKKDIYEGLVEKSCKSYQEWCVKWYDQYVINHFFTEKIENLDIRYNWRPLFGWQDNSFIIHYERTKPFQTIYADLKYDHEKDLFNKYKLYYFNKMKELELGE